MSGLRRYTKTAKAVDKRPIPVRQHNPALSRFHHSCFRKNRQVFIHIPRYSCTNRYRSTNSPITDDLVHPNLTNYSAFVSQSTKKKTRLIRLEGESANFGTCSRCESSPGLNRPVLIFPSEPSIRIRRVAFIPSVRRANWPAILALASTNSANIEHWAFRKRVHKCRISRGDTTATKTTTCMHATRLSPHTRLQRRLRRERAKCSLQRTTARPTHSCTDY